jgi:hypothetical protein
MSLLRQRPEYLYQLLCRLAGRIDNLAKTPAKPSMMIDARKAQVLERQMTKLLYRSLDFRLAIFNLL